MTTRQIVLDVPEKILPADLCGNGVHGGCKFTAYSHPEKLGLFPQ
ncbi:MAG: hypothetical protein Q7J31_14560 [Syntrophales bacterium]|nr:hypothetical protein [Syntrophales bacterium]